MNNHEIELGFCSATQAHADNAQAISSHSVTITDDGQSPETVLHELLSQIETKWLNRTSIAVFEKPLCAKIGFVPANDQGNVKNVTLNLLVNDACNGAYEVTYSVIKQEQNKKPVTFLRRLIGGH